MPPIPQPMPAGGQPPPEPPLVRNAEEARVLARTPAQCFRHGLYHSGPFLLIIIPFGLLFGVAATEAGLDLLQVLGFSVLVLAGASQFTAVQLLAEHTPTIIVILSALAVNLRMAMYSASLVPWLGQARPGARAAVAYLMIDQTYALSLQHYEKHPRLRLDQRLGYFFGSSLGSCLPWVVVSMIGATIGNAIPADWPLDFVIPITFLAMIAPLLRTLAHLAAALVAILGALVFASLPSGLGLLVAAVLAMGVGALVETWMARRMIRTGILPKQGPSG